MTKFSRIFLDRRHSGVTTLLYILIQYYNKINEKKNARMLEWLHCRGVKWKAVCVPLYVLYINIKRERERLWWQRARKDMWRRKCFFYMIINVSITQRHRHMVLKITYILSYSLKASTKTPLSFPPLNLPYPRPKRSLARESLARYSR